MLDYYFKAPHVLRRMRSYPAGPHLDDFARALHAEGYSQSGGDQQLRIAGHLCEWMDRKVHGIVSLDEAILARFRRHLLRCRCTGRRHQGYAATRFMPTKFLDYLRRAGVVGVPQPDPSPALLLVEGFSAWIRQLGRTEKTLSLYLEVVRPFIEALGAEPDRYRAADLRAFILARVRRHARRTPRMVTSAVRSFLRYLVAQGRCSADLLGAFPSVASWTQARLPRFLPAGTVERLLQVCGPDIRSGLRDHAMLLLLARLGLRAGDVTGMRLPDIDWEAGRVRVAGKGRREVWLPLPQDVGRAILKYLKHGRPAAPDDHVFLTVLAPFAPLRTTSLSYRVEQAFERAGVNAPSRGAHVLRHTLATRMLREGASLDLIGALLRHRDVGTTSIYAKVDVDLLREVAQPWPGGSE